MKAALYIVAVAALGLLAVAAITGVLYGMLAFWVLVMS